ncbi:MAG: hypothetical protein F6K10_11640 [Moorea sp. SIO2B7]|nr:hypothetical protein [Moorena sp. SIO2B7]
MRLDSGKSASESPKLLISEDYWEHPILDFGLGGCLFEPVSGEIFLALEDDLPNQDAPGLF